MREADVGLAVQRYFEERGYETFPEVALGVGEERFDLVAIRGPVLVIVECKATLSWKLLEQAYRATKYSRRVYAAIPAPADQVTPRPALRRAHWDLRVGLLIAGQDENDDVSEMFDARLGGHVEGAAEGQVRAAIARAGRSDVEPGQRGGGYATPFRGFMERVRELLVREPGLTAADILREGLPHHYASVASARAQLTRLTREWHRNGGAERYGLEVRKERGKLRLYAAAEGEASDG